MTPTDHAALAAEALAANTRHRDALHAASRDLSTDEDEAILAGRPAAAADLVAARCLVELEVEEHRELCGEPTSGDELVEALLETFLERAVAVAEVRGDDELTTGEELAELALEALRRQRVQPLDGSPLRHALDGVDLTE